MKKHAQNALECIGQQEAAKNAHLIVTVALTMGRNVFNAKFHSNWPAIPLAKKSVIRNFVIDVHIIVPKFVRNASLTTII